jgi:hypothetical protein
MLHIWLQVQTSWRAYVCRRDFIEYFAATIIQAKWKAFVVRADYLRYKAATKIQSTWRSYDCQMNYFNFLADILIMVMVRRVILASLVTRHWPMNPGKCIRSYADTCQRTCGTRLPAPASSRVSCVSPASSNFFFIVFQSAGEPNH